MKAAPLKTKQRLIVFDIDGTLLDSASLHGDFIEKATKSLGLREFNKNWSQYKHHTDSCIIAENLKRNNSAADFETSVRQIDQLLLEYYREIPERINLLPGARELLEVLFRSDDYDYCFATGALRKSALFKLSLSFDKELFENRVSTSSAELITREAVVQNAIDLRKNSGQEIQFEKIISVGDGIWDQATARNLDLEFVAVGPAQNRKSFHADAFIDLFDGTGLARLPEIIRS